jgi:aspartate aminotransferase-like enzyme
MATELKCVVKNQVNVTPAVSIVLGLKVALDIILKREGLQAVFKRHDRLARATRAGVEALGLTLFARATPSPAITAVEAPKGIDGEQVLRTFGKSHNITIAGGQGEMQGKVFRLGHMGYVGDFDVIVALSALELVLAELGVPADLGAGVRAAEKVLAESR